MSDEGEVAQLFTRVKAQASTADLINHPPHYTGHPSGVECISVTEHMGFNLGNAIKYIWRADEKGSADQDLEKARWYIGREIKRREALRGAAK